MERSLSINKVVCSTDARGVVVLVAVFFLLGPCCSMLTMALVLRPITTTRQYYDCHHHQVSRGFSCCGGQQQEQQQRRGRLSSSAASSGSCLTSSSSCSSAGLRVPHQRRAAFTTSRDNTRLFSGPPQTDDSTSLSGNISKSAEAILFADDDSSSSSFLAGNPSTTISSLYEGEECLSYLPNYGRNIPNQIRQVIVWATQQYVYGRNGSSGRTSRSGLDTTDSVSVISADISLGIRTLQDVAWVMAEEHRVRKVPVSIRRVMTKKRDERIITDGTTTASSSSTADTTSDDVITTQTGRHALDDLCAQILSLAALYQLPPEIALILLRLPYSENDNHADVDSSTAYDEVVRAFATSGWEALHFPKGLAVRPKSKYRNWAAKSSSSGQVLPVEQQPQGSGRRNSVRLPRTWWRHRTQTLQQAAAQAVQRASETKAPARLDKKEFLKSMQAAAAEQNLLFEPSSRPSLTDTPMTVTTTTTTNDNPSSSSPAFPLFQYFPKKRTVSLKNVRRFVSRQYTQLKKKGRAGFLSYCFFNFVLYTVGFLWQWPRMPILGVLYSDPTNSATTSTAAAVGTLMLRKFGKIFAYLYALSQVLKIPKLLTAVALAPQADRCLRFFRRRFKSNETVATVAMVSAMVLAWLAIMAIPVLSEYAQFLYHQRSRSSPSFLFDEQVMLPGLQPV